MQLTALGALEDWLKSRPYASVSFYGTVNLFGNPIDVEPWEPIFRDHFLPSNPEYMTPILRFNTLVYPIAPDKTFLNVYSRSELWLQKGQSALNERIGHAEADENLQNFAGLVKLLVDAHYSNFEGASMHLEGRTFHDEAGRIAKFFSDIQPLEIDGSIIQKS